MIQKIYELSNTGRVLKDLNDMKVFATDKNKHLAWLVPDVHLEPYVKAEVAFLKAKWAKGETIGLHFPVDSAFGNEPPIFAEVPKDLPMSELKRYLLYKTQKPVEGNPHALTDPKPFFLLRQADNEQTVESYVDANPGLLGLSYEVETF